MTTRVEDPAPSAPTLGEPPPHDAAAGSIKEQAVSGVGWTAFIHAYRVGAGLLTTCVLAYLLPQSAFGLLGSAAAIVGFLMLLKDLGTGAAIVQRKTLEEHVLCSIFWTNVLLGVSGTGALFVTAPWICAGLGTPSLSPVVQALSFMVLLAGLGTTHQSLLQRELRFARLARIEAFAITAGALAGITGALLGAGVWALVLQSLATMGLGTLLAITLQGWRPRAQFRLGDVRGVAKFSLNLTGFNVLNHASKSVDQLLILAFLGDVAAGVYFFAVRILLFPLSSINSVLARVLFPLFAKIQDDDERLQNAFLKVTATIALLVAPFVVGFAVLAEPIVQAILPPEWLPVIPLVAAFAVLALVQGLSTSIGNLYLAKARTGLMLIWGACACTTYLVAFFLGVDHGTEGVAWAYAIAGLVLFVPGIAVPMRLIRAPLGSFARAVWRPLFAATVMGAAVAIAHGSFAFPAWLDLVLFVPLGVVVYVGVNLVVNRDHVDQVLTLLLRRKEVHA